MKHFLKWSALWLFPLASASQTPFYIGQEIYIGSDAKLYTANHEVKLNANIVTETAPKGVLVFGENTTYSGATDAHKVVGFIANNFPAELFVYPVGSTMKLKPFELETASNISPVEIGYIASAPENPDDLEGVEELSDNGYWDINSEAFGKVKLYFTEEDLTLLSVEDFDDFSIAGYNGSDWVIIPSTVNEAQSYLQSIDFIDQADYNSYTFAVSSPLSVDNPSEVVNIITYQQNETIYIQSDRAQIQEVILFDIRGREIYRKSGMNANTWQISDLTIAKGIQIIVVSTDKGSISKKIIY